MRRSDVFVAVLTVASIGLFACLGYLIAHPPKPAPKPYVVQFP